MCVFVRVMTKKPEHPFASLQTLRDRLPPGEASQPIVDEKQGPARAVIRLERKQRRGKEVTVIEKLALPPEELEQWCRELKQACGCGGSVEDRAIVLQGDLRARLPALLSARGVA